MRRMATLFLSLRALAIAALAGAPISHAQELPSGDDAAWAAASELGTAAACQDYLEAFPAGRHAEEAFRCLIEGSLEAVPDAGIAPPGVDVY
jgi:hypothetical protein